MKWVIKMIYILAGQERYLMEEKLKRLKKEYQCNDASLNFTTYYGDKSCMEDLYEDYCTIPFLSEYKMIVLYNPVFLTTKKGAKNEEDESYLLKCIEQQNEEVIFVIFYEGEDLDNRKKIVKLLKDQCKYEQFEPLTYYKIKELVRKQLSYNHCSIHEDGLDLLIKRCDSNLLQLMNECNKVSLYRDNLQYEDIDLLVSRPLEDRVFELSTALVQKNVSKMMQTYHDLVILNQEPVALIIMIANKIRALYQVSILLRKGYTDKEITAMLGMNPFYLQKLKEDVMNFEVRDLLDMLNKLHHLDDDIKSGKIDKHLGLELFMLRI